MRVDHVRPHEAITHPHDAIGIAGLECGPDGVHRVFELPRSFAEANEGHPAIVAREGAAPVLRKRIHAGSG